jgi:hypothetical protein
MVTYAAARSKAAQTLNDEKDFIGSVSGLLTQSAPAYNQINQLFNELSSAANGTGTDITVAQAEQTISTVVSNRQSLAASARGLNAPTPAARRVKTALVAAMDASLTDDQQIDNCLNQDNFGDVAFIFQGCLDSTSTASTTANTAKAHFWSVYNGLRHRVGLGQASGSF